MPPTLADRIATHEGKKRFARTVFATIADRYDLITVLLSYGRDRRWKRRLIGIAAPAAGSTALDLATGTGDIAFGLDQRGARVVGLDITRRMIELARSKTAPAGAPEFLVGDMMALPFADARFELVTTGYGLRNVPDIGSALAEMFRVLEPGGQALSLDFNRPSNALMRGAYLAYLHLVGGMLGWLLHGDPDTYRYIPASIRHYPGARGVVALMEAAGFAAHRTSPAAGRPDGHSPRVQANGGVMTDVDTAKWSGEGTFTQMLLDELGQLAQVALIRVEDAPASRSDADYNFISNEIFVPFSSVLHTERVAALRRAAGVPHRSRPRR